MTRLQMGSVGPYVEMLQLALERSGFDTGGIDGIFGARTENALLQFQESMSLTPDGITTSLTWQALTPFLTGNVIQTIRQGDTLYRLAASHGSTIRAIETANPNLDPLNLIPGRSIIIPLGFPVVPTNISFTASLLGYCIRGLRGRYPFLRAGSIGRSVMGRNIPYITIGTGQNQVFYNASHHANEWITTPLVLKFLEDYAAAAAENGTIFNLSARDIFNKTTLFIAPMVNPDGVDLVTGAINSNDRFFRQAEQMSRNYPQIPFPSGWKANIRGVDLNLQYPAGWEQAREVKFEQGFTQPGPRDYVGSAALSEPESRAVYNFTRSRDFGLTVSYHTQGQVIFWKYLDFQPLCSYEIAQEFYRVSGYPPLETPYASGHAGYKDWFIMEYNRPGYTIEAGSGVNPLPISQFDEIYADNIGIMTLGAWLTQADCEDMIS